MSDVKFEPFPQYEDPGAYMRNVLMPESAMDFLDPGQHLQGEHFSEELVERETEQVKEKERLKIVAEKKEVAAKTLKAQRGQRKKSAARKGRRASIMSGPLGAEDDVNVRRATLGGGE